MNTSSSSIVQSDTVIVDTDSTQIKDALPAGTRLQNYILQRAIGQGGFGITYLATEKLTGRRVVIKENYPKDYKKNYVERSSEDGLTVVPNPNYKEFYDWSKKSFVKEAVTLIDLPYNPHIVRVLSVLEENNTAYIVMPLIEGRDMATCYQGGATMPESELCIFLTCMLGALAHLHAHNIIHRDIKPANILITPEGKPVLIDFGAARPDNTGKTATQVGTGGYAPPEQISEKLYDKQPKPHTDLYALGATCYRLITGYEPDYSYEQLEQDSSAMGSYSPELLRSIDKAREQKPEHRWQSAQEWLAEITTNNKKDTPGVVPTEPAHRSRSNVALTLLILVLALVIPGGYVLYRHAQEIGAQRLLVQQEAEQKAQEEAEQKAREAPERKRQAEADFSMGCNYYFGQNGYSVDYDKAMEYFRKAAEQGYADAQWGLGWCYETGRGVTQDYNEAVRWYRKAADQGNAGAQNNLGVCYANGRGVTQDYNEAVRWYRKAAEQGYANAQYNLGLCYANGQGVTQDYKEAVRWYRKAAEQGYAYAQNNLGGCYETGRGVTQDYNEAVRWYRKAAEQGDADAQSNLGGCYYNGRGVTQDYNEAVRWYRKAAEQGNAVAQCGLGLCYANGRGVTQDYNEAVRWYRKAAEQGQADAQNKLGVCYESGRGVTQDYNEAVRWYRKAAEQGDAYAQNNLGWCYETGRGVTQDYNEAVSWYRKAAEQGNAIAQHNLRRLGETW